MQDAITGVARSGVVQVSNTMFINGKEWHCAAEKDYAYG